MLKEQKNSLADLLFTIFANTSIKAAGNLSFPKYVSFSDDIHCPTFPASE